MSTRTTVVWVPDWPVVAAMTADEVPVDVPSAVHDGRRVTAVSALARADGVRRGMRRRQAQGVCPELVLLPADDARDARLFEPVAAATETVVAGVEVARPGLLLLPAGGASRYHGSEEALAERIVDAVARATGHECGVGTADGLLAAVLAARSGAVVEPGASAVFLAAHGVTELVHATTGPEQAVEVAALVDLLHRLGLRTLGAFAALPAPDVHARFGRRGTWAHTLARGLDERPPARRRPEADLEVSADLDPPVDRVDTAAFAGRRLAEELHADLVARSVTCGRLQVAARTDDGTELVRTWRTDLGGWGALAAARITDRIRWQLDGWLTASAVATARDRRREIREQERAAGRTPGRGGADERDVPADVEHLDDVAPVALVRLTLTALDVAPAGAEAPQLWGGPSGGDLRAHRALERAQSIVGGAGVLTATLQGGRDVRDQVHVRPWGEQSDPPRPVDRPWPGRLPDPAPATVLVDPVRVDVRDVRGEPVRIDARGLLSAPLGTVRVLAPRPDEPAVGRRAPGAAREGRGARDGRGAREGRGAGARASGGARVVTGWAGPWLLTDRWWAHPGTPPRVRAHLQVAFDDGGAVLLTHADGAWTCEAGYD
ncbi:DNA polymerase Y family protein [Cellulomonas iranensis]|uniref:DNA polymerase Y family protein n=1 Tax=Cellulomonas iranensis TaxID=76862 RepID=UPI001CF45C49|nr:DNA polymerase Y family protein [Cellulomonas iranensis]UCN16195.1 DNA polymerase Y family protein [Cellulomonas iranensis]